MKLYDYCQNHSVIEISRHVVLLSLDRFSISLRYRESCLLLLREIAVEMHVSIHQPVPRMGEDSNKQTCSHKVTRVTHCCGQTNRRFY